MYLCIFMFLCFSSGGRAFVNIAPMRPALAHKIHKHCGPMVLRGVTRQDARLHSKSQQVAASEGTSHRLQRAELQKRSAMSAAPRWTMRRPGILERFLVTIRVLSACYDVGKWYTKYTKYTKVYQQYKNVKVWKSKLYIYIYIYIYMYIFYFILFSRLCDASEFPRKSSREFQETLTSLFCAAIRYQRRVGHTVCRQPTVWQWKMDIRQKFKIKEYALVFCPRKHILEIRKHAFLLFVCMCLCIMCARAGRIGAILTNARTPDEKR